MDGPGRRRLVVRRSKSGRPGLDGAAGISRHPRHPITAGAAESLHFDNFHRAWTVGGLAEAALNTVTVTLVASTLTVAVAAPAAYYLSRQESRWTRGLTVFFVLGLGVPVQVILIPLFVMLSHVYLTNSLIGLNLVYIGVAMPFTVFLLTAFFRSLPVELEEAAALDGSSAVSTFWRIMLPVARGGLITAFVLNIIANWNETLLALALLQSTDKYTLPVALISFVQQQTYSGADWGGLFAGLCIIVIPILVVYIWLGRRLVEGLTLGIASSGRARSGRQPAANARCTFAAAVTMSVSASFPASRRVCRIDTIDVAAAQPPGRPTPTRRAAALARETVTRIRRSAEFPRRSSPR